jgi:hypothetical protein
VAEIEAFVTFMLEMDRNDLDSALGGADHRPHQLAANRAHRPGHPERECPAEHPAPALNEPENSVGESHRVAHM